jgi:hypothetical protein
MRARSYCARGFAGGEAEDGVKEVGGPAAGAGAVGPGGAATFGCGWAAAIVDAAGCGRAPTSSGSGSRKALRKPTSDCWRDSPETPDVEEEVGLAPGAGAEAETTLGCGAADDPGGGVDDAGEADEADETAGEDGAGEACVAAEADDAEETEDADDAGKREEDEQTASIGISAIAAAIAPKRRAPPRPAIQRSTLTRRHPIMPQLYQALAVNHKVRSAPPKRSPGSRSGVWRNLMPAVLYR